MASADLRAELECSVCLNIYTDPVTLKCGHNFCRVCIDRVLDTQGGSGGYSCPECRQKFQDRSALQNNRKLRNIAENFLSAQTSQDQSGVFCTYCVDFPVPAVRSCLHCEVSLCDKHLRVHKKSPEHILTDPTSSLESRKCSVHKEVLKYFCTEDDTCVCMTCFVIGEHTGHKMESLDEASGKKKETLRNVLQKLVKTREKTEERVQMCTSELTIPKKRVKLWVSRILLQKRGAPKIVIRGLGSGEKDLWPIHLRTTIIVDSIKGLS
ncbi:E3 ubiquitin/ISG15 ligase TRIM25-like [Mantella aurantiaca]